jgi:SAM-dependent methyltransferase
MSTWSAGYVSDVPYVPGYYPEQSPEFIRFAQLLGGVKPTAWGEKATYCELGFGLGLNLTVLAAVHPDTAFWGTDFNSGQVLQARELGCVLPNLTLLDASFEEFEQFETPAFDFIALHGIWSWVSPENQRTILRILKRKLRPGGAVYISYNAMPGWSTMSPLRELLSQHAAFASPAGHPATAKVQDGLALVAEMEKNQVPMIVGNRALMDRLAQVRSSPIEYVAHEYLNQHHQPLYFSQVASALDEARLTFVASSRVLNMLDGINLSAAAQQHLTSVVNPTFRQVLRDFYALATFRQDVFVRGARRLSPDERQRMLDEVRLHLVTAPADVPMKITGALGESTLHEPVYRPMLERLADSGAEGVTLGDLRSLGPLKTMPREAAVEATCMLLALGAAFPVVDSASTDGGAAARKVARKMLEQCERTGAPPFMPSPVTRNGHPVDRVNASFILGLQDGAQNKKALARRAWAALEQAGQRLLKDGKPMPTEQENLAELEQRAAKFLDGGRQALERLGLA